MDKPTLQDFSLIRTKTEKKQKDHEFESLSSAFYFVAIGLILGLQEDEIEDSITDSNFLKISNKQSGHDRGIDALYIDETSTPPVIHMFNCKYVETFEKAKNNNFPSGEIDKILGFLNALNQQEQSLVTEVNNLLSSKIQDIWKIFDNQNPKFIFHFCSNHYKNFEQGEKERLERSIGKNTDIRYHLMPDLVKYIVSVNNQVVNGKIKGIDKGHFEKSDGNIRALIVNVDARDLIRIVLDNEEIRNKADMDDDEYETIKEIDILEDAFNDNVRVYQKKSSINKNIKITALSEDNSKFFYYNNGVTLTCDSFSYSNRRSPIIELQNIQVVNGSQTIHSLHEAFLENSSKFSDIEILCRICEVKDPALSTKIAEYTNSQNPVKGRDIRSVDFVQLSLEQEFLVNGKFYERKKNQHADESLSQRIDAEKAGQVLIAFFNRSPFEAKNRKGLIFGDKYEEVFNEGINADKVLLAYSLFERIEIQKNRVKLNTVNDRELFDKKSYIVLASYYILHIIGELARKNGIDLNYANIQIIWNLYDDAIKVIESMIYKEQNTMGRKYDHSSFFRSNRSKKYFEDLDSSELDSILSVDEN
jgi:AIPR protein